jgi:maleate cis-trans isomerase
MFEEFLPKKKFGMLYPLAVSGAHLDEFYRLVPRGVIQLGAGIGLSEFSAKDVDRVFDYGEEIAGYLADRGVDLIMQSGVPLPILIGLEKHDRFLERLAKRAGAPATSSVLCVAKACAHLGLKNVALVNKWTVAMNKTLADFFAREGVGVAGAATEVIGPETFTKMSDDASIDLAYRLAQQAHRQFPDADGIYIGGGSWIVQPMVPMLEKQFGKPVIGNQNAMIWNTLHMVDYWTPIQGHGRLLASD